MSLLRQVSPSQAQHSLVSPSRNPLSSIRYSKVTKLDAPIQTRGIHIRFVASGQEVYKVDHRTYKVSAGQYLLIKGDQEVHCVIDANSDPVQSVWVHFSPNVLQEFYQKLLSFHTQLAASSFTMKRDELEICEQLYQAKGNLLGEYLIKISKEFEKSPRFQQEINEGETLSELAERLILSQWQVHEQIHRLTSAKLSTKKELYRRLCLAKRYIHSHLHTSLDLDTLSQVACLSKYHFIRLFKEVYGQTPRQYLISQRLERASSLLLQSQKSFHEICQEVGLKDSSSFGRLFKKNFGSTPHLYRRMHAG